MIVLTLSDRRVRLGIVILFLLPPAIAAIYIATYGVNVLFWDQWSYVSPILSHWYEHSLTFQDLFSQLNEHRLFFPRVIMLGIAVVTSYNTLAELTFSYILVVINLVLVLLIYLNGKNFSWSRFLLFIPVPWLVFSLNQYENLLWGWQMCVFIMVTGALVTVFSLDRSRGIDGNLCIGITGGVISSFSFMSGLMIWPVGFMHLLLKPERTWREVIVWIIASFAVFAIYFYGWIRPNTAWIPPLLDPMLKPAEATGFIVGIIANSFGYSFGMVGIYLAVSGGVAFLLLLIFILHRSYVLGELRSNARFVALIAFAFLSLLMLTVGRGNLGLLQANASRYVTFTVLGVIGVYLLSVSLFESRKDDRWMKGAFTILCILIFSGIVLGTVHGLAEGAQIREERLAIRDFLLSSRMSSDTSTRLVYSNATAVHEGFLVLRDRKLNVFSGIPPDNTSFQEMLFDKSWEALDLDQGQDSISVRFKSIGGLFEPALYEHSKAGGSRMIVQDVNIQKNSTLLFEIGMDPETWSEGRSDGVEFQVYVDTPVPQALIFSRYLDPKNNLTEQKWNPCQADLSPYAGKRVDLIFSTLSGPSGDSSWDWAWWGNPRICF